MSVSRLQNEVLKLQPSYPSILQGGEVSRVTQVLKGKQEVDLRPRMLMLALKESTKKKKNALC